MAPIEWKDNYSVGVAAVDHEHRELIDLVNALQEAMAGASPGETVPDAFGDLFRAISSHFALEERFMREHRYDQLDAHKADHEHLLDDLRDMMEGWSDAEGGQDAEAVERFSRRLEAWFTEHFSTHDARLHTRLGDHPH